MKSIIIAGTNSGAGKTTLSIAIMRALTEAGLKVAPFKVGPDYIDPKFHSFAASNKSYNLDSWMLDEDCLKYLFIKNSKGKDISVIEGVMGLYDGIGSGTSGSTAHVAKILGASVVLVANCRGMSSSAAAMIKGYIEYDKEVKIKGVILNNVSGESHYSLLKEIIVRDTGISVLGFFPRDIQIELKDRHLGLVPVEELGGLNEKLNILSDHARKYLNLREFERIAAEAGNVTSDFSMKSVNIKKCLRVALARDEAFNFYYNDNLNLMRESGFELVEFSPLHDKLLPKNINGIYIGGGFPEIFAKKLSENSSMREDIRSQAQNNMPVYAECGGLMYLTGGIIDQNGAFYEMAGFFKCRAKMTDKLQRFGYVEVEYDGVTVRAHEFHHTILENIEDDDFKYKYKVRKKTGKNWLCGLSKNNVLAGYPHIHFYSNIKFYEKILSLFKRIE